MADEDRDPNGGVRYPIRDLIDAIRIDISGIREELRANRHDLANKLGAVALRVEKLEHQQRDNDRRWTENEARADKYVPLIEHLLNEDTLAARVRSVGWTRRERFLAYGLFLAAIVGAVGTLVSIYVAYRGG